MKEANPSDKITRELVDIIVKEIDQLLNLIPYSFVMIYQKLDQEKSCEGF